MAANIDPIFIDDPRNLGAVRINTANANLDGTGTITTLVTGAADGTIVETITIKAEVTTTAGMIRLFKQISGTYYIFDEIPVSAITKSATVASFKAIVPVNEYLASGQIIAVSTEKAEMFSITASGGNY